MRKSIKNSLVVGLTALVLQAYLTAPCRAALTLTIETVPAAPGDSDFVELRLTNTFATDQTLSAFSIDIALGGTGVQFTSVDDQTTPAYVFAGTGSGTLTFDVFPNQGFIESDLDFSQNGYVTLVAGQTYGLGRIGFAVQSGAATGLREITLGGSNTYFVDGAGSLFADADLAFGIGGVQVQPVGAQVVPEPAMMTAALSGVFLAGVGFLWRRRKSAA